MPSVTLPTTEDKNIVKKALPTSKILTSAVARLYVVLPHTSSWTYSQHWGAVTFCKDKKKHDAFFLRIVDLENHMGVIWEQELYEGFEYTKDKPYFHAFDTDDYLAGFEFVDEGEAETFYKKVTNRDSLRRNDYANTSSTWKLPSRASHIDKKTIGNPANFRHVGHIGYTTSKGFTIEHTNPEMISQLKALGITPEEIHENQDFIQQFLNQHDKNHAKNTNSAPPLQSYSATPPPTNGRRPPPPPPPSRKRTTTTPNTFPPIPPRGSRQSQPPSTIQPTVSIPPPPPPPPPPMISHAPVRTSPLPPMNCPPPPSSAPSVSNNAPPPTSDGRLNLMASIRATGGIGSLRKATPSNTAAGEVAGPLVSTHGGDSDHGSDNLASSLAAVLKQRQTAMQSDDEEDDEEWE